MSRWPPVSSAVPPGFGLPGKTCHSCAILPCLTVLDRASKLTFTEQGQNVSFAPKFGEGIDMTLTALLALPLVLLAQPGTVIGNPFEDGQAALDDQDYDRAIVKFTEAIRLDPKNAVAYVGRGRCFGCEKRFKEAINDFSEAIRIDPKYGRAYHCRSNVWAQCGEFQLALADADEAVRFEPERALSHAQRGAMGRWTGDYDGAIAAYSRALELDPVRDADKYYFGRGDAYKKKGEYGKALADFEAALLRNPGEGGYHFQRGDVHRLKGEYDQAIADMTDAINLGPQAAFYLMRGVCYVRNKDLDRALADYTSAIQLDPNNASQLVARAHVHMLRREYAEGIADAEAAMRRKPNSPDPYQMLAWVMAQSSCASVRDGKRALEYAKKACELKPEEDTPFGLVAAAYAELGDFANAIVWANKSLTTQKPGSRLWKNAKEELACFEAHRPFRSTEFDEWKPPSN